MKHSSELKPNYGPVYAAALYPDLCELFHHNGYALAVHGSLARDFDLIAVPWCDDPTPAADVIAEIERMFAVRVISPPAIRACGRVAHTLSVGFGRCAVDLSFFPNAGSVNAGQQDAGSDIAQH